jgi:hypothetical protein
MKAHQITMLGTGLIGEFYTATLHGQRARDHVRVVFSKSGSAARPSASWDIQTLTDLRRRSRHADRRRRRRLAEPPRGGREPGGGRREGIYVRPLRANGRRSAPDAPRRSSRPGSPAATSRTCYTPKSLKAVKRVREGAIGDVTWVRSRETHPGPHSAWFWDGRLTGGGAIIDLGCHCIEIIRNFVGKGNRPLEILCHTDTLVHPIADEDNAVALIRFESGRSQFEVGWTPGRDGPS